VKKRGHLKCGVSQGLPGFSTPDNRGNWTGIDVDFCKAVAAAIFNDADKVKFTPLSAKERFTAIQSGEVDIIARNTTWSMHRDTALGVDFPVINYYDGQGFMVRADLGVRSARDLDGATLCTNQGTTTELNAADYFRSNGMQYEIVAFEKADESVAAYNSGRCDAYTTDHSALYAQKLKLSDPKAHIVLPEVISKEPLGPLVRQGDAAWNDLVRWTHYATVAAEEFGVTSKNISKMKSSSNPSIRRLMGQDGSFGDNLGLSKQWAVHIIRAVGNYGEIFERNVGVKTPLGIKRGVNALWTKGGLQYAPPIR
jgi:general L-amino acid transport system substrate-binding protein